MTLVAIKGVGMLRKVFLEVLLFVVIGSLIGTVLAFVANGFVYGVEWLGDHRGDNDLFVIGLFGFDIHYASLVYLWLAAVLVILIKYGLKLPEWSGPADAIYAAQQDMKPLDTRAGFASVLASFVSAGGGASVGQYGPLVLFGSTAAVWLQRILPGRIPHDVYLGCGVAAAISAGFNAPVAGVIFAHEAILRHFSLRAIAPIAVASIVASAVDKALFPRAESTIVISQGLPSLSELVPLLLLVAPLLSLLAIAYMKALRSCALYADRFTGPRFLLPFFAATICGMVGIGVPQILGLGIDSINAMIAGHFGLALLVTVLVAKLMMTALCIGFGLAGGVFSPALFIGVACGALVAQVVAPLGFGDAGAVISVASMAAVTASVVGAPITMVLVVLELTSSYEYAVAAMLVVTLCNLITHRLFSLSYFDRQLLDRGIDLRQGRAALYMELQPIGSLVKRGGIRFSAGMTGQAACEVFKQAGYTEGYVCDDEGRLLGKLSLFNALSAPDRPVSETMDKRPLKLMAQESLADCMMKVSHFVGETIPVVDQDSGKLQGVVTEGDLFRSVIDLQEQIRQFVRK